MQKVKVSSMFRRLFLVGVVLAVGVIPFVQSQTSIAVPQPDCGPTRQWICIVEGEEIPFEGTICEKIAFERENEAVCYPA